MEKGHFEHKNMNYNEKPSLNVCLEKHNVILNEEEKKEGSKGRLDRKRREKTSWVPPVYAVVIGKRAGRSSDTLPFKRWELVLFLLSHNWHSGFCLPSSLDSSFRGEQLPCCEELSREVHVAWIMASAMAHHLMSHHRSQGKIVRLSSIPSPQKLLDYKYLLF